MSAVDVCLCTFRRAQVRDTLQSLAAMINAPPFRVIVADNDDTPSARNLVESTATALGLAVTYLHAPARNISVARNACLEAANAPLIAFIDDDELASPGWLAALVTTIETTKADVVLGPVRALYAADCPHWIRAADFHSTAPVWVAGEIVTGYTSNVIFRRETLEDLRFREDLGRSGGEDTAFFTAAYAEGARIAYADAALLTETVPPERASFRWLARRRFRAGQTHGRLLQEENKASLTKPFVKTMVCSAMALLCLPRPPRMKYWLLRAILHMGVIARLLGRSETEHYG